MLARQKHSSNHISIPGPADISSYCQTYRSRLYLRAATSREYRHLVHHRRLYAGPGGGYGAISGKWGQHPFKSPRHRQSSRHVGSTEPANQLRNRIWICAQRGNKRQLHCQVPVVFNSEGDPRVPHSSRFCLEWETSPGMTEAFASLRCAPQKVTTSRFTR